MFYVLVHVCGIDCGGKLTLLKFINVYTLLTQQLC